MKTKNFLLTGALLIVALFSVNGVMAQGLSDYVAGETSDNVKVNLIFRPIQSIQVNTATDHKAIDFVYETVDDYMKGANEERVLEDHLIVYHSGPFNVTVESSGFKRGGEGDAITGDHVKITANPGTNNNRDGSTYGFMNGFSLGQGGSNLFITSKGGGMGLKFDVTYNHDGWKSIETYTNMTNNNEASTYTANVTYTITAK